MDYPTAWIDRPLVLPQGMGRVGLHAREVVYETEDGRVAANEALAAVVGAVGLGRVELGLWSHAFVAPRFGWTRSVTPRVVVSALDGRRLDLAPALDVTLFMAGGHGTPIPSTTLDLGVRWAATDRVWLALGPGEDAPLAISIRHDPLMVPLPVRVGYQVADELSVSAEIWIWTSVLEHPVWQEPNLGIGLLGSPLPRLDLAATVGVRRYGSLSATGVLRAAVRF